MNTNLHFKNFSDFKTDDIVYACAYEYASNKDNKINYQKPILGKLTLGNSQKKDEERRTSDITYHPFLSSEETKEIPSYFVSFGKNGTLVWSKAVTVYSRHFSYTEKEAINFFNASIQEKINWHLEEIEKLKENLIKEHGQSEKEKNINKYECERQ